MKSISVVLYEKNRCNSNFKKRNLYVKNGFKKKENKLQKHGRLTPMVQLIEKLFCCFARVHL